MKKDDPHILLVDDYSVNLEILDVYLKRKYPRAQVFKAENGKKAFEIFKKNDVDLVLLDIMLPDINGFELCTKMKHYRRDDYLPIIIITALNDRNSLLMGLSAGADDFLTKPINVDELSVRVKNLLKLRKATVDLNERYQALAHEMKMARELLYDFLPKKIPEIPELQIETIFEPSTIICGGFYDIFQIDEFRLGVFMADVKGHGAASAMMIALLKEQLYRQDALWLEPAKLLKSLNLIFCEFFQNTRDDYFITASYLVINLDKKTLHWANAGHTAFGFFRQGEAETIKEPTGLPLGVLLEEDYESEELTLEERDAILLYTDGIFELPLFYQPPRTHNDLEEYIELLRRTGIVPSIRLIFAEIKKQTITHELSDDVNAISIYLRGG